jgi:DNA-binding PadR family transcriptional regulator
VGLHASRTYVAVFSRPKRQILEALEKKPMHGYEISKRTGLPLTGIYTHLRELEEEGLLVKERQDRRIMYTLSGKGRLLVQALH